MDKSRVRLLLTSIVCLSLVPATLSGQSVERELLVSVLDADGAPVPDLAADDFLVREDGALREVLRATRNPGGRQIALLVDTSTFAQTAIRDFRLGVTAFVDILLDGNDISLIGYGGPPRILVEATRSRTRLEDGVGRLFAFQGSAAYLLDAIRETAQGFARREATQPVVVVLTTEGLDHSSTDSGVVLRSLAEAGVALYAVVLLDSISEGGGGDPLARWRVERDLAITRGPARSGGRRKDLLTSMGAEAALREIATEIREQYLVRYARPDQLIPPERIEVDVRLEGLQVRGTPVQVTQ